MAASADLALPRKLSGAALASFAIVFLLRDLLLRRRKHAALRAELEKQRCAREAKHNNAMETLKQELRELRANNATLKHKIGQLEQKLQEADTFMKKTAEADAELKNEDIPDVQMILQNARAAVNATSRSKRVTGAPMWKMKLWL